MERTCKVCLETKEITAFPCYQTGRQAGKPNGSMCKPCYAQNQAIKRGSTNYKPTPKTTKDLQEKIIMLYEQNTFPIDIAKQLGVSSETVRYQLRKANIPVKEPWVWYELAQVEPRKSQIQDRKYQAILRSRKVVLEALTIGCKDCPEKDVLVLEFDHRDPSTKSFSISNKLGAVSDERLLAEIAKCDIVCANCHRKRTAKMFGSWRVVV